jgi:MFS family permease
MADVQAGVGPFLGVFLLGHGWGSGWIGTVMTLGAVAGVLMTAPAGAWVDASRHKRTLVALPGICTVLACAILLVSDAFWPVALSQVASAVAGVAIGPAVSAITLGVFRQNGFVRQNGLNQAYNHAGNAVGAALSGLLGWQYGLPAVFGLAALFAIASVISVMLIPAHVIDDRAARGLSETDSAPTAGGLEVLLGCRPLVLLAAALALFHLGNAAMLPLYGMAVSAAKQGNPAAVVGATIVVAQTTMVAMSVLAMRMAERQGYWPVLMISFAALPVRGLVAACLIKSWGVFPVQILDGVGAGLQSVAVPGLVARLLNGTGRVNVGLGAVMTAQGVGAALSPALGGWLAQASGYGAAFLALGALSVGSLIIWIKAAAVFKRMTNDDESCDLGYWHTGHGGGHSAAVQVAGGGVGGGGGAGPGLSGTAAAERRPGGHAQRSGRLPVPGRDDAACGDRARDRPV